jgi:hypothetical protein
MWGLRFAALSHVHPANPVRLIGTLFLIYNATRTQWSCHTRCTMSLAQLLRPERLPPYSVGRLSVYDSPAAITGL